MKKLSKKKIFFILLFIAVLLPVGITFSRYVKQSISKYIMESNDFYFNSDKLTEDGTSYEINNWSGIGNFVIQFNLNNRKNNILSSSNDIAYVINSSCDENVICSLDNTSGIIYKLENEKDITLTVTPNRSFNDNESILINVTASSISPYEKTLSATFKVTVGKRGISYEITDQANQPYFMLNITNAINSYKVKEAFGNYSLNQELSIDEYLTLSDSNKLKCASAIVTLSFDPNIVIFDTTSDIMKIANAVSTNVNGISYISQITFKVEATSSNEIRFYKKDPSINYTYPITNDTSIVTFTAET